MIRDGLLETEIRRLAAEARRRGLRVEPCCGLAPAATEPEQTGPVSFDDLQQLTEAFPPDQSVCLRCLVECGRGLVAEYACPGGRTHCACGTCAEHREEMDLAELAEAREREEKLWAALVAILPATWQRTLKRAGARDTAAAWAALTALAPAFVRQTPRPAAGRRADAIAAEIGPVLWGELDDPVLYGVLEDYPKLWTGLVGSLAVLLQLLEAPDPEALRPDAEEGHEPPAWMADRPVRGPPEAARSFAASQGRRAPLVALAAAVVLLPALAVARARRAVLPPGIPALAESVYDEIAAVLETEAHRLGPARATEGDSPGVSRGRGSGTRTGRRPASSGG